MKIKKLLFIFCIFIGLCVVLNYLTDKIEEIAYDPKFLPVCDSISFDFKGRNIYFPITMAEAIKKFNLKFDGYQAYTDLTKDTVMIVKSSSKNQRLNYYDTTTKDSLDYIVYAYLFYFKNPTKISIENFKNNLEKKYRRKFINKRLYWQKANDKPFYLLMNLDKCVNLTIKPSDDVFLHNFNCPIDAKNYCVFAVYYRMTVKDVEAGNIFNGEMDDGALF